MSRVIGLLVCRLLDSIDPSSRHVIVVTPEHGDVLEPPGAHVVCGRVPVVAPTHLSVRDVEVMHKVRVVVGDTATTARLCDHGRGVPLCSAVGKRAGAGE